RRALLRELLGRGSGGGGRARLRRHPLPPDVRGLKRERQEDREVRSQELHAADTPQLRGRRVAPAKNVGAQLTAARTRNSSQIQHKRAKGTGDNEREPSVIVPRYASLSAFSPTRAKYRTPFALATPFADFKVSNIRRLLLTGVLLLNLLLPSFAQAGRGGRGIDQNGDGVIGDNEGHLAAAPRIISDRSDGTRQTVVDLMQLVHVIEVGMDVDGDGVGDLDPSRVSYFGNSLGGIYGTILLAVEPSIRVGVAGAAGELIESFRLGGAGNRSTVAGRRFLASRNPSLLNSPGITKLNGVVLAPPYFNENLPLRDGVSMTVELEDGTTRVVQSPVINAAPGAMAIQEVFEH